MKGFGCGPKQKVSYSKGDAERAAREMREMEREVEPGFAPMTAYKCRACSRWHIGHSRYDRV